MASPEPPTLRSTWITERSSSDDSDEPAARHHRVVCRRGLHACRVLLPSMSRSLNVNVGPGSRRVGFSLGCARPRPLPCTPAMSRGRNLGVISPIRSDSDIASSENLCRARTLLRVVVPCDHFLWLGSPGRSTLAGASYAGHGSSVLCSRCGGAAQSASQRVSRGD